MLNNIRLTVKGKVQGVFYRASAKQKADELGICGWVRNLPDGSVYIEAEGEPGKLESFYLWCNVGPERAEVSHVVRTQGEVHFFKDFKVVR